MWLPLELEMPLLDDELLDDELLDDLDLQPPPVAQYVPDLQ